MLQIDSKRECVVLYPLMLFSSFVSLASDKRKSKLRPGSFHRDLLSDPQENSKNADMRRPADVWGVWCKGGRAGNRNEGGRWTEVREAIERRKVNLKDANSRYVGSEVRFIRVTALFLVPLPRVSPDSVLCRKVHIGLEFWTDHQGSDTKLFHSGKDWKAAGVFCGWPG